MIILGIDPGTATTGYGLIKGQKKIEYLAHGIIKTPVGMPMGERLLLIRQQLKKVIVTYKPMTVVIEQLFFGRNAKTAMMVGQARGVILMTASEAKLPIFEYQGLWVKRKLSGDGHASKKMIQQVVRKTLGLYRLPKPDDAADALALAICYLIHEKKV